jgi:hypothetical protein
MASGDREGPNGRECEPVRNEGAAPQKTTPTRVALAPEDRVRPERTMQRGNPDDAARITSTGGPLWHAVNLSNRRMRARMSGGVGGDNGEARYPLSRSPSTGADAESDLARRLLVAFASCIVQIVG